MHQMATQPLYNESTTTRPVVRVTLVGAIANVLMSVAKITVGIVARSQALVADGVHTVSDLATDIAILWGAKHWSAPADATHPYGHGRLETLINLFIAGSLAAVGIGIGRRALMTLTNPHEQVPGWAALVVALLSIATKETLYRWTAAWGRRVRSSALVANAWHHRSDALSSIPVVIAILGARLFPNMIYLDHIAALFVTVMLLKATWRIGWPAIRELMETPSEGMDAWIIEQGMAFPAIRSIHKVQSRSLGGAIFVDMHMQVDPDATVEEAHELAHQFHQHVMAENPNILDVMIHVEPFSPPLHRPETPADGQQVPE